MLKCSDVALLHVQSEDCVDRVFEILAGCSMKSDFLFKSDFFYLNQSFFLFKSDFLLFVQAGNIS